MKERQLSSLNLFLLYIAFIIFQSVCLGSSENVYSDDASSSTVKTDEITTTVVITTSTEENIKDDEEEEKIDTKNQVIETETTTSKPEETEITTTGPSSKLYRLRDDPCIMLQVDWSITFTYITKTGEEREKPEYVPENVDISGDCSEADTETFSMKWESFVLKWSFAKTPGHEEWYVNGIELKVDATSESFQNINSEGPRTLSKSHTMLFPTRVGKSYSCESETVIELNGGDMSAKMYLQLFRLQAFNEKSYFGPEFECTAGGARAFRDETAPLAVGSTLAIVVLLTVTGYGVYRYFKIKKVQYDTME